MEIRSILHTADAPVIMRKIGVDPYGINLMAQKAKQRLFWIKKISSIAANILKQEALSLGAEVAVPRSAITAKAKYSDCLLIINDRQLLYLLEKLDKQPFGLTKLKELLKDHTQEKEKVLKLRGYKLKLNRPLIMGIINLTPDSFSGDGLYKNGFSVQDALSLAKTMVKEGADIIDIGAESSRPGAKSILPEEEIRRCIPVLKVFTKYLNVPVSVDTYKYPVAKEALKNGAAIINDISGLKDTRMAEVIARHQAGVVIMHMQGNPSTMQKNPHYKCLVDEIIDFLRRRTEFAERKKINPEGIVVDPGIGFGKTLAHNLEILHRLAEFKTLNKPLLVGTSRKSFIGILTDMPAEKRLSGTIASCLFAIANGADIIRVHDVKEINAALKVYEAIKDNHIYT